MQVGAIAVGIAAQWSAGEAVQIVVAEALRILGTGEVVKRTIGVMTNNFMMSFVYSRHQSQSEVPDTIPSERVDD